MDNALPVGRFSFSLEIAVSNAKRSDGSNCAINCLTEHAKPLRRGATAANAAASLDIIDPQLCDRYASLP